MAKIIREYNGRTGKVLVIEFNECGCTGYKVESSNKFISNYWTKDKMEAIKHAQFLAAKY